MRLILLGAPGSGKGTQGVILADHFDVDHISSGELLRKAIAAGTPLGCDAEGYVLRGELVPDDLVLDLVTESTRNASRPNGYVLDGFPRTLAQAERAFARAVLAGATADAVVYLDVDDDTARERLLARAVGRADDGNLGVIDNRLEVFHRETQPLLDFYGDRGLLVTVDATGAPEAVNKAMIDELTRLLQASGQAST